MFCLTSVIFIDSHRSDEPKVPDSLCQMIASWMHEYDVKTINFSLVEVSEDEQ